MSYWAIVSLDKKRMRLKAEEERLIRSRLSPMDRERRDVGLPPLGESVSRATSGASLVEQTESQSLASRIEELERRLAGMEIPGDFSGTVTGKWEGIGPQGEGLVSYKGKVYKTKRVGFASVPLGAPIELVYANGVYYSNY